MTNLAVKLLACRIFAAAFGLWFAMDTSHAFAQSVGVQFVGAGGDGIVTSSSDGLTPSETAGAPNYAQANWNTFGQFGDSVPVTNSVGAATSLFMNWDSGYAGTTGSAGLGTPDGDLLDGFILSWGPGTNTALGNSVYNTAINDKPLVYVSGINSWYKSEAAEGYSIVLYITGYAYYETSERWIQSVSGNPLDDTMVGGPDLTPHLFDVCTGAFLGTYVQVPPTANTYGNAYYGANYEVLSGLTNDAILIRNNCDGGGYGGGLNGFQIVPIFPTNPAVNVPIFTPAYEEYAGVPSEVYALSSVTITETALGDPFHTNLWFQWYSDNATGGGVTNAILNATNSTVTVIPTNNATTYYIQYLCVVSNIFGASTSSIAQLTVDPAVAPILTQDTTPGPGNGFSTVDAYVGSSISFTAAFGGPPGTFLWQSNSVGILNATNTTLTLNNLQLSASASYDLTCTNIIGSSNSTPVSLVVLPDPPAPSASEPYDFAVFTNHPWAYWRLNETLNPADAAVSAYDSSGNYFDGLYGTYVADDQPGPTYAGFAANDTAASFTEVQPSGTIVLPSLDLNTNAVTFTAWIYPTMTQQPSAGLLIYRNGGDAAGFGFGATNDANGDTELGYVWNNNASTYNFNTGLCPPINQWSFVALTITPTNATIYLFYVNGGVTNLTKVVNPVANTPEAFSGGTTWLGGDSFGITRNFGGTMGEVAVFDYSMSESQIQNLYLTAIGASGVPPVVVNQPTSTSGGYSGFPYQFSVTGSGAPDPGYQWQSSTSPGGPFSNINNGGQFSGATSGTLTINDATTANEIYYQVVLANPSGSITSSVVDLNSLILVPTNGQFTVNYDAVTTAYGNPGNAYSGYAVLQGDGTYWNTVQTLAAPYSSSSGLTDNQLTDTGIRFAAIAATGTGLGTYSYAPIGPIDLLDGYMNTTAQLTNSEEVLYDPTNTIELLNVPNGKYNLAFYGTCGEWANRGDVFSVNGAVHSLVNGPTATDLSFREGVNATMYTNVTVTGGTLDIGWWAYPNTINPGAGVLNNEGDFNGMQIQLIAGTASGNPARITGAQVSGGNFVVSGTSFDGGQGYHIVTSTNLLTPLADWTPVASGTFGSAGASGSGGFTNTVPITPGQPAGFFRVTEP